MITPSQEVRRTEIVAPRKPTKGLDAIVDRWVGVHQRRLRVLNNLLADAEKVDHLAGAYATLSDHHLRERLEKSRTLLRRHPNPDDDVILHALAAIREAAERKLGLRPYVVQLAGALALYRGYLAEMATGEGKTLTAGVAAVLFGWSKHPCHIVTVNDYLAERDAAWMRPLYHFCEVSVGHVTGAMDAEERRKGYAQDVAYCTSKEIVADFLRDRLRLDRLQDPARRQLVQLLRPQLLSRAGLVMRGLHTAIVDEADSVLADEAVTPVIISQENPNPILRGACMEAGRMADGLRKDADYRVNLRYREVEILEPAKRQIEEQCASLPGLWRAPARSLELVKQALTARELFHESKQYVIQDNKIVIVDEFTGRMMPQRTWREGLHQAVEAKEGLDVSDPSETLARLSFQRFFRFFRRLSGMTGTAWEAADEFWHMYRLAVVSIPTNEPCVREELPDRVFADEASKWDGIVEDIADIHARGQPILVGTRSIRVSERLSELLTGLGLEHQVLNAVRHREEAQIIAAAGHEGKITIATNMAGRGTDIKLSKGVAGLGGLCVLATERHESRRIDRQLFGRSGRQGDPGRARAYVSADDELLHRFVPNVMRGQLKNALSRKLPGAESLSSAVFAHAQRSAQRTATLQRRTVLKTDTWIEDSLSFAGIEHGG